MDEVCSDVQVFPSYVHADILRNQSPGLSPSQGQDSPVLGRGSTKSEARDVRHGHVLDWNRPDGDDAPMSANLTPHHTAIGERETRR